MWNKVANIILRNRFFIIGIIALISVFLGFKAATGLRIDNKYGNMLPDDTETQKVYQQFKKQFGEDGTTLVIAIQDKNLYTFDKFKLWKSIGDKIRTMKFVEKVRSEVDLKSFKNDTVNETFVIKKLVGDFGLKETDLPLLKKENRNNPIYQDLMFNNQTNVTLMAITINEDALQDKQKQKVVLDIEEYVKKFEKNFGKVHFAGLPHMRVLIGKRILNEMYIFIALSILASSVLMYFFFRSIRITMICNIVVLVTVLWSMGTIALFGYSVSIMMALIPPLMIVIGIPNCIYLYNKYHQEFVMHKNKAKALHRTIRKTGVAMWLTNVTTALGFMTFLFTSSDKFFEFGVISSVNIMLCYVVSLCLVPILASFSKAPLPRHTAHLDRKYALGIMEKLVHITARYRPLVYILTIIITAVSAFGIVFMKVTGNLTGDLPPKDPILTDIKFVEKHFGGTIPFEILIEYKEKGRLFGGNTLKRVEEIQSMISEDTLFARTLSVVDAVKYVNMIYYNNDINQYKLFQRRDMLRLKKYMDNVSKTASSDEFKMSDLVDTTNYVLRIRTSMRDIGSYKVSDHVNLLKLKIDSLLNPDKQDIERLYAKIEKGDKKCFDSILESYGNVYNATTSLLAKGNNKLQMKFDSDTELIKQYYKKPGFKNQLRKAIDREYYTIKMTGVSVVAAEGTRYLVNNLLSSILFAILSIAALMCILFYSVRMVVVSMIPNIIPMVVTAGIMGWFGIPLKPSTLLIFSIALGITVDNTIHFLARYRQELKLKKWDLKDCVAISIRETGLSIIYTSVILFFGFIVFVFSDFGGTQALGYLSAITYFVALFTNLILLPSLLLSYERRLTTKSFEEPLFDVYDEESDSDWDLLEVQQDDKKETI